ncbi:hypothetical protein [Anditalea andensis]|uniref:SMODS-associating 2TM beta-strand rich effector domain-containing protein n=1 Tax=Anditalea andensis TaxID=1048983 RepID=A0A074KTU2_9BACT|nr:hypothetical protein [Anditalea andensis]KEO71660.1 hypothetical protein EL17_23410 [Anditalea andensis]
MTYSRKNKSRMWGVVGSLFMALFMIYSVLLIIFPLREEHWGAHSSLEIIIGVLSASVFTLLLFIVNEYVFYDENLAGIWLMEIKVVFAAPGTTAGYTIVYRLDILKKQRDIIGKGEKIYEISPAGKVKEYLAMRKDHIIRIEVDGYLDKKYLAHNEIRLLITEHGLNRKTTASATLNFSKSHLMQGEYISTAANSYGTISLQKYFKI